MVRSTVRFEPNQTRCENISRADAVTDLNCLHAVLERSMVVVALGMKTL